MKRILLFCLIGMASLTIHAAQTNPQPPLLPFTAVVWTTTTLHTPSGSPSVFMHRIPYTRDASGNVQREIYQPTRGLQHDITAPLENVSTGSTSAQAPSHLHSSKETVEQSIDLGSLQFFGEPAMGRRQTFRDVGSQNTHTLETWFSPALRLNAGYTLLEAQEDVAYNNPPDQGPAAPTGTLVFDSSSPQYPAATYIDLAGNLSLQGNLQLAAGSGASVTMPDSTLQTTAWNGTLTGGDYAESVDVSGDYSRFEPGDGLTIDPSHPGSFLKVTDRYSTLVAGMYSTKPGLTGRRQGLAKPKDSEVRMAMVGIVPTKVSAENGSIHVGDLLVASSVPGHAMKGTARDCLVGAVIGKALASLESGTGVIEVLITLQ